MHGTPPIVRWPAPNSGVCADRAHASTGAEKNNPHYKGRRSVAGRFSPTGV